jgi:hypothetical protein
VCSSVGELAHIHKGVSSVLSSVKSTIPAFKVCVFEKQYGEHFWTVIDSLQSVVLVMNICHTPHSLDLVTISVLSCGHTCAAECLCVWVVIVGYLTPVFCQVYARRMPD